MPPWQFLEQQSAFCVQALPSVVQSMLPEAGTGILAHWPPVHIPEQHWSAPLQLCPSERQAPLAHVPPEHVRLQHSVSAVQGSPAGAQNRDALHFFVSVLQAVEQQSAFDAQVSPPATQVAGAGAVQKPP